MLLPLQTDFCIIVFSVLKISLFDSSKAVFILTLRKKYWGKCKEFSSKYLVGYIRYRIDDFELLIWL